MQNDLRQQVKILKAVKGIQYQELAEYLEIKRNSFYNWMKGYYDFSLRTEQKLKELISILSD